MEMLDALLLQILLLSNKMESPPITLQTLLMIGKWVLHTLFVEFNG